MAYTRTDAAAYLADEWSADIILAEMTGADTAGGVKTVIDRVFSVMGVARADLATATVADVDAVGAEPLLDKYMARRLHKAFSPFRNFSSGEPAVSVQARQAWENIHAMLTTYDEAAEPYESSANSNSWQAPTYAQLDTYEPEWAV